MDADDGADTVDHPTTPAERWRELVRRVAAETKADHVTLTAAGVAFFAFLAIVPGIVALVSVYGLVADPTTLVEQVEEMGGALPEEARALLIDQLEAITASSESTLTLSFLGAVAVALWAASSGMTHLIEAVALAHDEGTSRSFVVRRGFGILLTVGAIAFVTLSIATITAWPVFVDSLDARASVDRLLRLAVWPVLGLGLATALAIVYRVGSDRMDAQWRWITPGSLVAVVLWLVASVGFQVYVTNFGSYNETYGSLGAVVVLLLWLWISAIVTLVGAEVNAELAP
jgi:membrane protein